MKQTSDFPGSIFKTGGKYLCKVSGFPSVVGTVKSKLSEMNKNGGYLVLVHCAR
jgi:hypothetical protein